MEEWKSILIIKNLSKFGKDYKKEFTWVADNQTRLKDSFGVEYSFTTDSK